MLRWILASSRHLVLIAVLGTLAASLTLPRWLVFRDLEDLKANLVSIVIAVLAVLFLREAVSWDGQSNLLQLAAALALMIAVLIFFLSRKSDRQN